MIVARRPRAKAFVKSAFFNQERKSEARRRSDTVVVPTVNDADRRSAEVSHGLRGRPPGNLSLWVPGGVWSQS